ncbi:MAG: ABC transporter permease subunit [Pirellulaceae bacterium]
MGRWITVWHSLRPLLLKVIDVTGLTFARPIVNLCYGDHPRKQLAEIGRLIVIPVAAFAVFLMLWNAAAPHHKTKSGEVPTPGVVWEAARSVWTFHCRESDKERAFLATGETREQWLTDVQHRLETLVPYEAAARHNVERTTAEHQAQLAERMRQLQEERQELASRFAGEAADRDQKLRQLASNIIPRDVTSAEAYLRAVRDNQARVDEERDQLRKMDSDIATERDRKSPPLEAARRTLTLIAEEKQYLTAMADQLSSSNRQVRLDSEVSRLRGSQVELLSGGTSEHLALATTITQSESRIHALSTATYAKPWTLPMQIVRSVACVFVGFVMGSVLAIPVGVMCGLSRTFMAAVTPFITLFKPVSPIVWLPIALIIVGGFIPDPDRHWLIRALANLPLVGWMKVNPAFIASAITVALCSLWATMANTALGVASVDKDHLNVARVLRLGLWSRLYKIIIPSALPLIFAGLRISLGVGWMVLIAGELLSSSEGIGKFVWDQFNNGASDSFAKMIVVVFVVGVIGLLLDRIMIVMQRLASFERDASAV